MKFKAGLALILTLIFTACATADQGSKDLETRVQELEKELASLKKVLKVVAKLDVDEVAPKVDSLYAAQEAEAKMQKEMAEKVHNIPLDGSPFLGPENAPITITEFSDFECPYCAKRAPIVKQIQAKYPNKVKVVFKHFPLSFHKNAPPAHAASIAAHKQGKFWEYRFKLAPYYRSLTEAKFLEVAKSLGLNMEQFKKDMKVAGANKVKIDKDMELGAEVGVRGTPTFYVNGKLAPRFGFQMIDDMVKNLK